MEDILKAAGVCPIDDNPRRRKKTKTKSTKTGAMANEEDPYGGHNLRTVIQARHGDSVEVRPRSKLATGTAGQTLASVIDSMDATPKKSSAGHDNEYDDEESGEDDEDAEDDDDDGENTGDDDEDDDEDEEPPTPAATSSKPGAATSATPTVTSQLLATPPRERARSHSQPRRRIRPLGRQHPIFSLQPVTHWPPI